MSHFWTLMNDEFGESYAGSLARDHVLGALGNRTVLAALEAGVPPREVWEALCEDMDIPAAHRLGRDTPEIIHTNRFALVDPRGQIRALLNGEALDVPSVVEEVRRLAS